MRLIDPTKWQKLNSEYYIGTEAYRLRGGRDAVRVFDPPADVRAAWELELQECVQCTPDNPVQHGTASFFPDGSLYTYQCRSGSRAINPTNGEIVGHSHCTCDGCF